MISVEPLQKTMEEVLLSLKVINSAIDVPTKVKLDAITSMEAGLAHMQDIISLARQVRACDLCSISFWPKRKDQSCCTPAHANRMRVRRTRDRRKQ